MVLAPLLKIIWLYMLEGLRKENGNWAKVASWVQLQDTVGRAFIYRGTSANVWRWAGESMVVSANIKEIHWEKNQVAEQLSFNLVKGTFN